MEAEEYLGGKKIYYIKGSRTEGMEHLINIYDADILFSPYMF
jgi:hypothetical protein